MGEIIKLEKLGRGLKLIFIGILVRICCAFALLVPYGAILTVIAIYAEVILVLIGLGIAEKQVTGYRRTMTIYVIVTALGLAESAMGELFTNEVAQFLYITGKTVLEFFFLYFLCFTTSLELRKQREKGIASMGKAVYRFFAFRTVFTIIYGGITWFATWPEWLDFLITLLGLCYVIMQVVYIVFLGRSYSFFEQRAGELEKEWKEKAVAG